MDTIDREILKCLRENARMTASAVSAKVNLSVSAVTERIRRLEESGAIRQYTVLLDPEAIQKETLAYMEVTLAHDAGESFCHSVAELDSILRCDYIAEEFDYLLLVQVCHVEELSRLHTTIKGLAGVKHVRLRLILKNQKYSTTALPNLIRKEND